MQMVVLSLKCTSITHKNTITTGNTFSYCSMYPIHSVLVVSAIVVKVTIFPKTLCGSLAIRDQVAHYNQCIIVNTDDVSSWNFNVGIIMMASMYVLFCVFDKVLLVVTTPESRGSFVMHSSGQTQYGDENTKGDEEEVYEYTVQSFIASFERESVSKYRGVMSGLAFELDRILIWFGLRVHIVLLTHDIFKYRHGSWMHPIHLVCQIHF